MSDLEDLRGLVIPGLRFRPFAGEADYPAMAALFNRMAREDDDDPVWDVDALRRGDQWFEDFDPALDRVIIEMEGTMIGSARVRVALEPDGTRMYGHGCGLLREWRGKGIERAILQHNETRLREIAQRFPEDKRRLFRIGSVPENNLEMIHASSAMGYEPIRYSFHMVRPHLENIPHAALPDGLDARPVVEEEVRAIWDANLEAFRDHWGYQDPPANGFDLWRSTPTWDRTLSRVAWTADGKVAGMVLIFVPRGEEFPGRKRMAETEQICVTPPWRRKGVATALIARCLQLLKEAGFEEASLGVDTQNLSGALRIYERMGYRVKRKYTLFQKAMEEAV
jgi:GNAT superfamily N-acetyltransferase